jgi:hypothetical protein
LRGSRRSGERRRDRADPDRAALRHATDEDLDQVDHLLQALRSMPGLHERRRGYFSRGARAFAHFHADGHDVYADVRLTGAFQRVRVTTDQEQAVFLATVRDALTSRGNLE